MEIKRTAASVLEVTNFSEERLGAPTESIHAPHR